MSSITGTIYPLADPVRLATPKYIPNAKLVSKSKNQSETIVAATTNRISEPNPITVLPSNIKIKLFENAPNDKIN